MVPNRNVKSNLKKRAVRTPLSTTYGLGTVYGSIIGFVKLRFYETEGVKENTNTLTSARGLNRTKPQLLKLNLQSIQSIKQYQSIRNKIIPIQPNQPIPRF